MGSKDYVMSKLEAVERDWRGRRFTYTDSQAYLRQLDNLRYMVVNNVTKEPSGDEVKRVVKRGLQDLIKDLDRL